MWNRSGASWHSLIQWPFMAAQQKNAGSREWRSENLTGWLELISITWDSLMGGIPECKAYSGGITPCTRLAPDPHCSIHRQKSSCMTVISFTLKLAAFAYYSSSFVVKLTLKMLHSAPPSYRFTVWAPSKALQSTGVQRPTRVWFSVSQSFDHTAIISHISMLCTWGNSTEHLHDRTILNSLGTC